MAVTKTKESQERQRRRGRQEAVSEHKRGLILKAAREVFENEGLEGASIRAIAARAGYTGRHEARRARARARQGP